MNILFYAFVILGLLFHLYLIPAWFLNKKRDRLIDEWEKQYTKKRFLKCPGCGVLNAVQSKTCVFCNKSLPESLPPQPQAAQSPPKPLTGSGEKDLPSPAPDARIPSLEAQIPPFSPGKKARLDSFFYKNPWPMPTSTVLISLTSIYLLVIFIYGFAVGIYRLGKEGVKQVQEASQTAAKRHAERNDSLPEPPPPPSSPQSSPAPQVPVRTPTPIPSPSPLVVTGSEDEQIVQLMLYLENKDWNIATQARKILATKGKKAALALVKEIDHPDSMIRTHVITALGELGEPETAPRLILALRHEDFLTVIQATTALGNIRAPGVVDGLVQVLKHPDWRVRHAAIAALKAQGNPRAIQALEPFQSDPNERLRSAAKEAVATLNSSLKKE